MASPFSLMLIFFKDSGGRAMYWERASRVLEDPAGMCTEASTLNPECLQLIKLVAILALISCFFKKNLMITRRKYSENRRVRFCGQEGLGVPGRSRRTYRKMVGSTRICNQDWCMVSPYGLDAGDALRVARGRPARRK